jgi:competence protein ComEC
MRETGTLHLMAISGLHIALAASLVWLLAVDPVYYPATGSTGKCLSWPGCSLPLSTPGLPVCNRLRYERSSRLRCWRRCGSPVNGLLAGLVLLCRGDPDKRSLGRTFAESAPVSLCRRGADFLVSVAASSSLAPARRIRPLLNLIYLQVGMLLLLLMPLQVLIFHGFSISSGRESLCRSW